VRRIVMSGLVMLAAVLGGGASAATAAAAPAPTASAVSFLPGKISCGAPKACLAVGTDVNDNSGAEAPVAEKWNGTAWKSVAVKTPKGKNVAELTGVSCKSATSCLVVGVDGSTSGSGGDLPYALTWNGTSLTPTAAPPVPKGARVVILDAVSCVTAKSCVAVGIALASTALLVVETWNGAKWTLHTAKSPGTGAFAQLAGIRCFSVTSCVVVGESFSSAPQAKMLVATWNGKTFTAMKAAAPAGAGDLALNAVSCASAKRCVAAGLSLNSAGTGGFGFTEAWNGTSWTAHKVAWPKRDTESYLQGVSCVTQANCVAVGSAGASGSDTAKALSYNGTTWALRNVPGPGAGNASAFTDVSCPKANDCVAFGVTGPADGSAGKPLAGLWNGTSWRLAIA